MVQGILEPRLVTRDQAHNLSTCCPYLSHPKGGQAILEISSRRHGAAGLRDLRRPPVPPCPPLFLIVAPVRVGSRYVHLNSPQFTVFFFSFLYTLPI